MASPRIFWMVQEDERGRWRDFPDDLADRIEVWWQEWQETGGDNVVAFVWPNAKQTVFTPYEIVFGTTMVQQKLWTHKRRKVRRVVEDM